MSRYYIQIYYQINTKEKLDKHDWFLEFEIFKNTNFIIKKTKQKQFAKFKIGHSL